MDIPAQTFFSTNSPTDVGIGCSTCVDTGIFIDILNFIFSRWIFVQGNKITQCPAGVVEDYLARMLLSVFQIRLEMRVMVSGDYLSGEMEMNHKHTNNLCTTFHWFGADFYLSSGYCF